MKRFALLALLVFPSPAQAVPKEWVDYGLYVAHDHFADYTCRSMTVTYDELAPGGHATGRDLNGNCAMALNPTVEWTASTTCTSIVHEYGHLIGLLHNDKPGDVMNPAAMWAAVPACVAL